MLLKSCSSYSFSSIFLGKRANAREGIETWSTSSIGTIKSSDNSCQSHCYSIMDVKYYECNWHAAEVKGFMQSTVAHSILFHILQVTSKEISPMTCSKHEAKFFLEKIISQKLHFIAKSKITGNSGKGRITKYLLPQT